MVLITVCAAKFVVRFTLFKAVLLSFSSAGLTEREILRQEMVAQLCMGDKTHSQLVDLISFRGILPIKAFVFL